MAGCDLGSLLAMLFTGIWPQRAFYWRINWLVRRIIRCIRAASSICWAPRLDKHLPRLLNDVDEMRALTPASKRNRIKIFRDHSDHQPQLVCMLGTNQCPGATRSIL
ncbi:hypothetical protein KCP73_22730 [Salmonella enterica subsp. enterica]|nr:hypothetical protein KCP73_22730 [Salmonella enterica subsp. enterica]